jgi:nucleotide-binding universal stress UspA family protein
MRMVIGVDWSEEAFAAVQQATTLYLPQEVTFAHGVDLGIFQHPIVAEVANLQGYDEFRKARYEAGRQLMEHTATMIPPEVPSAKKACEFSKPATLVLETAAKAAADIIAVGGGGRGRMTELLLGSVSHRIALHATCTTLIVKGSSKQIRHVLVALEERDDAARMRDWLRRYPFRNPADLTLLRVVQPIPTADPFNLLPIDTWEHLAMRYANSLLDDTVAALSSTFAVVNTKIATGNPVEEIAKLATQYDLLVIGSHSRNGIERFLLGSVSHALLHHAPGSVLVVR